MADGEEQEEGSNERNTVMCHRIGGLVEEERWEEGGEEGYSTVMSV